MAYQRFYGKEGGHVSIEDLMDWLRAHPLKADGRIIPLMVWGAAGIGKTQQIKGYCRERGLELRTYHPAHDVNGADLIGRSYADDAQTSGGDVEKRTRYALPAWLPVEGQCEERGVLFIDELNRANEDVLAGLMEPLGEGTLAQSGWKLPDGWQIVCAGNPQEGGYKVNDLDEALVNRMVHYAPGWDAPGWTNWARGVEMPDEIIDYALRYRSEYVEIGEEQLPNEIESAIRCSPRTLEYVSALYEPGMSMDMLRVCSSGLLGRDAAIALRALITEGEQTLTAEEILATPENVAAEGAPAVYQWSYDSKLAQWKTLEPMITEQLILASVIKAVAELSKSDPNTQGDDGVIDHRSEPKAQLLGRFLSKIDAHLREQAFSELARSAPRWEGVVRTCAGIWIKDAEKRISQTSAQAPVAPPAQLEPPL